MKKLIKLSFIILMASVISSCSLFKKGCKCPKFSQEKLPVQTGMGQ
ncbi:MAG: hypothetical protein ABIP95_03905 [Pelobium sp.]